MNGEQRVSSGQESAAREQLDQLFEASPIPVRELLSNLALYMNRQSLTRTLFIDALYREIVDVHGIVVEFGVRWGQNLALFSSLRGMYEPYNHSRRIVGFDTFSGFPSVASEDGDHAIVTKGGYGVTPDYEDHLERVLAYHEQESPLAHMRKFELVKGDVVQTLPAYLERNPQTIVALAYFDLDLYEPTKACLEAIRPYCTRGTVLGFDELAEPRFPGETVALREVFGTDRLAIRRFPTGSLPAYAVLD